MNDESNDDTRTLGYYIQNNGGKKCYLKFCGPSCQFLTYITELNCQPKVIYIVFAVDLKNIERTLLLRFHLISVGRILSSM